MSSKIGVVGRLVKGAIFGEVAVLGLFKTCMVTIQATKECNVFSVPANLLQSMLQDPAAVEAVSALERMRGTKKKQVVTGMPLCGLPCLTCTPDDVGVRILALLAQRFDLAAGAVLHPLADNSACGPHFLFVHKGRAEVIIGDLDELPAMQLMTGCLCPEGILFKYCVYMRAVAPTEVYRVRWSDFLLATHSTAPGVKWVGQFYKAYEQAVDMVTKKLENARGVANVKAYMNVVRGSAAAPATPSGVKLVVSNGGKMNDGLEPGSPHRNGKPHRPASATLHKKVVAEADQLPTSGAMATLLRSSWIHRRLSRYSPREYPKDLEEWP